MFLAGGGGGAYKVLNYRVTVDFFENYRNNVIKFLYKYRYRSIFLSLLGYWNTKYQPFSIHIDEILSKKLANTEYRHIIRPPLCTIQY